MYDCTGSLEERYEIYVECMQSLGQDYMSFDDWLET